MGDCLQKLGDLEATAQEAPGLAAALSAWLVAEDIVSSELEDPDHAGGAWTRGTSGLKIEVARQVYYGGQGGVGDAACPNCGDIEPFRDFSDALDDWFKLGIADHACPACARRSLINDWILEPQWGVGHLQLTFWNWPPLSKQFRQDVSAHLSYHRLVYIYDKF